MEELAGQLSLNVKVKPITGTKSVLSECILQPGLTVLPHKKPNFLSNNPIISTHKSHILSSYNEPVQFIRQELFAAWLIMETQGA